MARLGNCPGRCPAVRCLGATPAFATAGALSQIAFACYQSPPISATTPLTSYCDTILPNESSVELKMLVLLHMSDSCVRSVLFPRDSSARSSHRHQSALKAICDDARWSKSWAIVTFKLRKGRLLLCSRRGKNVLSTASTKCFIHGQKISTNRIWTLSGDRQPNGKSY
jgi:hypothetical protein